MHRLETPAEVQLQLFLVLGVGIGLYVAQKRASGLLQTLLTPCIIVAGTGGFQAAKLVSGSELESWNLALPTDSPFSLAQLWSGLDVPSVDWPEALLAGARTAAIAALPSCMGRLMGFSALEQMLNVDVVRCT